MDWRHLCWIRELFRPSVGFIERPSTLEKDVTIGIWCSFFTKHIDINMWNVWSGWVFTAARSHLRNAAVSEQRSCQTDPLQICPKLSLRDIERPVMQPARGTRTAVHHSTPLDHPGGWCLRSWQQPKPNSTGMAVTQDVSSGWLMLAAVGFWSSVWSSGQVDSIGFLGNACCSQPWGYTHRTVLFDGLQSAKVRVSARWDDAIWHMGMAQIESLEWIGILKNVNVGHPNFEKCQTIVVSQPRLGLHSMDCREIDLKHLETMNHHKP